MMDEPSEGPVFAEIQREPTLAERVSTQLLEAIIQQDMPPGHRLPSERDLAEQFGVSRTVIREAVRTLSAKGLIDVRTGSGLRVSSVPASTVSESLKLYLHGRRLLSEENAAGYAKIHDVRQTIEVHVAGLAADHARTEHPTGLHDAHEAMRTVLDDVDSASLADVRFHRAIAEMTGNELYLIMLDSIGDVLLEIRRLTLGEPGRSQRAFSAHGDILRAITSGDVPAAQAAMQAHLDDSRGVWLDHNGAVSVARDQ